MKLLQEGVADPPSLCRGMNICVADQIDVAQASDAHHTHQGSIGLVTPNPHT
jgi:hypothetical protein